MQWLHEGFAVSLDATTVNCELKKLGYAKLTAPACHHEQNELVPGGVKTGALPSRQHAGSDQCRLASALPSRRDTSRTLTRPGR